jgi:hypothetical protein
MALWGKTQNLSIHDQLLHGVRYLDVRLCFLSGQWVLVHGMVGESLRSCVAAVVAFLSQHATEFVILHVLSATPRLDMLDEVHGTTLAVELEPLLQTAAGSDGGTSSGPSPTAAAASDATEQSPQQPTPPPPRRRLLLQQDEFDVRLPMKCFAGRALLLSHADPAAAAAALPSLAGAGYMLHDIRVLANPWGDQNTAQGLRGKLCEFAAACATPEHRRRLFLLQLVLTPREDDVVKGVKARAVGWNRKRTAACLHALTAANRDRLLGIVQELAAGGPDRFRMNIVMCDFVEMFADGVLQHVGGAAAGEGDAAGASLDARRARRP